MSIAISPTKGSEVKAKEAAVMRCDHLRPGPSPKVHSVHGPHCALKPKNIQSVIKELVIT